MQLTVISRYRTQAITYEEGQVLDLTDEQAAALLNDTVGHLRSNGGRITAQSVREIALSEPGRVFRQFMDYTTIVRPWLYADSPKG